MEEDQFIKCESEWPSELQDSSSNSDCDVQLPTDNQVVIKVEPDIIFSDSSAEDENAEAGEEEHNIEDEMTAAHNDESTNCSVPANDEHTALPRIAEVGTTDSAEDRHSSENQDSRTEEAFKCEICEKSFIERFKLKRHAITHLGLKPYACNTCGKKFTRIEHLKTHNIIHTGEKPHHCKTCGKSFAWRSNLHRHLLVYSHGGPYVCDVCAQSFNRRAELDTHSKTHPRNMCSESDMKGTKVECDYVDTPKVRPFVCIVCDKAFARRAHLKEHLIIHSIEKPHNCPVCAKGFNQRSHLTRHSKIHSGVKPHNCTACDKSYASRSGLMKHLAAHSS